MRVVVTGASGNVGTSVVERLVADPAVDEVVGLARRQPDWLTDQVRWVSADVSTDDLRPIFDGADAVIHLAWLFQPTRDPATTWRVNAVGSGRVFDAAGAVGVRTLVHASSVGTYSARMSFDPVTEDWPTHALPTAGYGREKSYVERLLDIFECRHPDVRVVRMRPGFIFKRGSASEQRRLFAGPFLPGRLVRAGLVPLVPHLEPLRFQVLHSSDAAEAYALALTRPVRGAFNLASEPVLDTRQLAGLLDARAPVTPPWLVRGAAAAAWHLRLVPAQPELLDLVLTLPVLDTTRARTELGWTPTRDALSVMEEFLDGLRAGAGFPTPPLDSHAGGRLRLGELATGVGGRDPLAQ